jgi:hypothetical protein
VIDFRYHLVSIIAVFLALAIGIVVGSTALQPAVRDLAHATESVLRSQINSANKTNSQLTQQRNADQQLAQVAAPRLLAHLLSGQSVVLVVAPGASDAVVTGLTAAVQQAGGTITGQVALQPQFFDTSDSTEAKLTGLAQQLATDAGLSLTGQPASGPVTGQQAAAQVLAAALVQKDGDGLAAPQAQDILAGLGQGGYLQVTPTSGSSTALPLATTALVVAPATPPATSDGSPPNLALLAVAEQLQSTSAGTVLAGSLAGSGPGSAIDEAVGSGKISTVDDADVPVGQITTVWALAELLDGHAPTSYGVLPRAVPSPAPTPSASPSLTPTPPTRRK